MYTIESESRGSPEEERLVVSKARSVLQIDHTAAVLGNGESVRIPAKQ